MILTKIKSGEFKGKTFTHRAFISVKFDMDKLQRLNLITESCIVDDDHGEALIKLGEVIDFN